MDLKEFEHQVLTGQITDFEPYFKDQYNKDQREQRYILAKNGIETDRVEKMDGYNTIVDIINDGLLPERYEKWKHHPRAGVRQALADNGYFYDYLINDENPYIRRQIIEKNLRLGLQRLDNDEDRDVVRQVLARRDNDKLELDILKAYIDAEKEYGDIESVLMYPALKLKYDALSTTPTTIEKTMTPAQLYVSDSPRWAHDYDVIKINQILTQLKDKPKTEEVFNKAINFVTNGPMMFDEFGNIDVV